MSVIVENLTRSVLVRPQMFLGSTEARDMFREKVAERPPLERRDLYSLLVRSLGKWQVSQSDAVNKANATRDAAITNILASAFTYKGISSEDLAIPFQSAISYVIEKPEGSDMLYSILGAIVPHLAQEQLFNIKDSWAKAIHTLTEPERGVRQAELNARLEERYKIITFVRETRRDVEPSGPRVIAESTPVLQKPVASKPEKSQQEPDSAWSALLKRPKEEVARILQEQLSFYTITELNELYGQKGSTLSMKIGRLQQDGYEVKSPNVSRAIISAARGLGIQGNVKLVDLAKEVHALMQPLLHQGKTVAEIEREFGFERMALWHAIDAIEAGGVIEFTGIKKIRRN